MSPRSLRPFCRISARAAPHLIAARITLLCVALSTMGGCATLGHRGPKAEKLAKCHDLTQQAESAMELGQWQRAELLLQQALEASPDNVDARKALAESLWHRGATTQAVSQIDAALQLRPHDANLAVRAGEMALATGDRDIALVHANEAIRLNPQLASAWALRGRAYWQLKQPDRALADFNRALEFEPTNPEILLDAAVIYRQQGHPSRCLTTLHHLHDLYPPGQEPRQALLLEGLTLLDLGRPYQACDTLLAVTQRGEPDAQSLYYLAQAQIAAGRPAEATAAARQALAIDAGHQGSQQLLAQLAAHSAPTEPQRR